MTGQSVAKSLLLSASVIPAHLILSSPVLGSLHTACPSSLMLPAPKSPPQIPFSPSLLLPQPLLRSEFTAFGSMCRWVVVCQEMGM